MSDHTVKSYEIDWDKVETLEDLKGILVTFGLVFRCPPANIDHIAHLVKQVKPEPFTSQKPNENQ